MKLSTTSADEINIAYLFGNNSALNRMIYGKLFPDRYLLHIVAYLSSSAFEPRHEKTDIIHITGQNKLAIKLLWMHF